MKRVFRYDKWKSDKHVIECLEGLDENYVEFLHQRMQTLDGKTVKFKCVTDCIKVKDGFGWDSLIMFDWTDPAEKDSILADIIMVVGGTLAVYGLAMLCQNLKDLLCSMM